MEYKMRILTITLCLLTAPLAIFAGNGASCPSPKKEMPCQSPKVEKPCQPPVEETGPCSPQRQCYDMTDWSVAFRAAAYIPLSSQHRDLYGTALPSIQLETAYTVLHNCWHGCDKLDVWLNGGWVWNDGETIDWGYYTRLYLFPIAAGIKYSLNITKNLDFYLGIGPAYTFVYVKNYDGFKTDHISDSQFGFMTKTGIAYTFFTNFYLDVFADYFFTRFGDLHSSIQNVNNTFSAFFIGGGIGYKW